MTFLTSGTDVHDDSQNASNLAFTQTNWATKVVLPGYTLAMVPHYRVMLRIDSHTVVFEDFERRIETHNK